MPRALINKLGLYMKLFAALILSSLAFAQPGICDEVVNCVDLTGTYELVGDDGLILERKIVQDGCKSLTADQLVTWREQTHQFDGLLKKLTATVKMRVTLLATTRDSKSR